jgi:UDP:flavonoid glycosyltransferase YjiC (YdhE family)
MGRFLFSTFSEEGFFFPAIGLGRHLVACGHSVAMVAEESGRLLLESNGIECLATSREDAISCRVGTWGDQESISCHRVALKRAIEAFQPHVMVVSALTLSGLIVREEIKIPTAVLGFASYLFPRERREAHEPSDAIEGLRWWRYSETFRILETARARLGLSPHNDNWKVPSLLGDLYLLRTVPALEDFDFGLPTNVRFVGACVWEPESEDDAVSAWVDRCRNTDLPIVYAQVGRSFKGASLWPALNEAFATDRIAVIASVSRCDVTVSDIPTNFLVLPRPYQNSILTHAAATVCDGHSTAVLGSLLHGVPCVLAPNGSGTEEIAFRCQRAGVAEVLHRTTLTSRCLRAATVAKFADSGIRAACSRMQRHFAEYPGFVAAGLAVESLLVTG